MNKNVNKAQADATSVLKAQNISFAYDGARSIFMGTTIEVRSDERVALIAASGVGKTTLARILAGYAQPTAGKVLLDGKPLARKGICPIQMIGQHPELALDPNLRLYSSLKEAGEIDPELIRNLEIHEDWLTRYPHELSGGELQRFCVARALAVCPKFLIADEISTMLDALTQAKIWHYLLAEIKRRGIGLIFMSHSPALAEHIATRKVKLD